MGGQNHGLKCCPVKMAAWAMCQGIHVTSKSQGRQGSGSPLEPLEGTSPADILTLVQQNR